MKKLYLISPDREHPIPDFINMKDLPTCKSTNEFINENLDSLSGDIPLLVSADIQTEGKGRDGRKWIPVGEGGIYISYLLSVNNRENLGLLSLAAGTAVAEAVAEITGLNVQLKWPNDIELSGLKAGGVLIENKLFNKSMFAVIGIGLNVNVGQQQIREDILKTATSLSIISGRKMNIGELILRISEYLLYFTGIMENGLYENILDRYLFYLKHKQGDKISFHYSGKTIKGEFKKINDKGALVLELKDGKEETFFSGEINSAV
ncbi:MAG: biotin--[acetyl-CoA-carboxylase] ligase [Candidatus Aminicenantes bacterium]|nr:biotin--[acetyl-CoA-carboxylase] ligase [Candidatus Aminicenantes bacterium]